jgi:prepilin-type N-terminal cleavage/methylation domain-containing protein
VSGLGRRARVATQQGLSATCQRGFGLPEVIVALTLLTTGLLGLAGLVRAVGLQSEQARLIGERAMVAQEALEQAIADRLGTPSSRTDTARVGSRVYEVVRTVTAGGAGTEAITVRVQAVQPTGSPMDSFVTRLRRRMPLPASPPPGISPP